MPVAMHTWLEPVNAKMGCDILLIEFKSYIYKHHGKIRDENRKDQQPYGKAFEHILIYPCLINI